VRVVKNNSTKRSRKAGAASRSKPEVDSAICKSDRAAALSLGRAAKRAFDLIVAVIGLILLSPIFLLSSLAILLESRGPIVCPEVRHGYDNESIGVLKFRSTKMDEAAQAAPRGPCVTRVGRVLRSTGIDELPQLINVLRGEMSIVGPRPYMTIPARIFEEQISRISTWHEVKPGITGWAQVNGCWDESNSFKVMRRRIEYDLYYIENWSLLLDMKIIVSTLFSIRAYLSTDETAGRRSD
jgi:lipopolysaccharide/colanic/teichoic acid biosynthesis glycosyltransferase